MSQTERALLGAKIIVTNQYLTALIIFPLLAFFLMKKQTAPEMANATLIGLIFLVVGVTDYIVSLFIEKRLLARAVNSRHPSGIIIAAIITGAFGVSFAIYGLVLVLMHIHTWPILLFVMSFVHGVHLLLRWSNYTEAARAIEMSETTG